MPIKDLEKRRESAARASRKYYLSHKPDYFRRAKESRRRLQDFLIQYKADHPCPCGEDDPCCLVFHHRDPDEKEDQLSDIAINTNSMTRALEEIAKCDVMCMNCHAKLHHRLRNALIRART